MNLSKARKTTRLAALALIGGLAVATIPAQAADLRTPDRNIQKQRQVPDSAFNKKRQFPDGYFDKKRQFPDSTFEREKRVPDSAFDKRRQPSRAPRR